MVTTRPASRNSACPLPPPPLPGPLPRPRLQAAVGRQAREADREHDEAGQGGAVRRLRRRGAAGQRGHHRDRGHRLSRAAGRQRRRHDREHDPDGECPPRQARRVHHVAGVPLHRRRVGDPGGEAEHRPGQCGGRADDQATRDHDQAEVAFGRADRAEHAEGTEPALGQHRETGYRHQANERQAEHLHHKDLHRRDTPAHLLRGNRYIRRRDTGHRLVAEELLCRGRAEQHDRLAGMPDLARGDQRELVRQVAGVLYDAGHLPGRAARVPGAARVRAVPGRHLAGQRDLSWPGRVCSADQAEQRRVVVPVRALGAQLHRLPGASRDVLLLDEIGRPQRPAMVAMPAARCGSVPGSVTCAAPVPNVG